MKLHRFNDEGINRFGQFLDALSADATLGCPPIFLQTQSAQSQYRRAPKFKPENSPAAWRPPATWIAC